MGTIRESLAQSVGILRGPKVLLAIAVLAALLVEASDADARQCRINITASGPFQGEVVDQGAGRFTRNAIEVKYEIGNVALRANQIENPIGCPRRPGDVTISADEAINPLMFHFLNEVAGSARVDQVSHRFEQVNATMREFQQATRKLQTGGLLRAAAVIAITGAWDVTQALVPLGLPAKLAADFGVEAVKEAVKGGNGDGLTKWLTWKIPSLIAEVGLSDDAAKALAKGLEDTAKGLDRELADRLKPVTMTHIGSAGECDIVYSATLNLKANRFHVDFLKTCGDREPEVPIASGTDVSVDPGANGSVKVDVKNASGTGYALSAATITGLVPVMPDGSAEPNAVLAPGVATFNFTAASPRKDDTYPVIVNVTTTDGETARWSGNVIVNNVGPQVLNVNANNTEADPGERLSIQNATVTVKDDNADSNNASEVDPDSVKLGPHPGELEMTRNDAFGNTDGDPRRDSFDSASGTYVFSFDRDGGRVKKPQMHKTVSVTVTVRDEAASATGALSLKVNDVEPRVEGVKLDPQFVHRNNPPKTITITGRFVDDNGAEDIDRPESYADVSKASTGVDKLVLGADLRILGAPGEDFIEFEGTFPQTNIVGAHPINIVGLDKKDGDHPDGGSSGDADINFNVGNAAPVFGPTGYIYDLELQTPVPDQQGKGLCPGQPFRAGAMVTDPEGDALIVTATIRETGQRVVMTLAAGSRTHLGVLNAPGVPGDYTIVFEARERDLDESAAPRTHKLTVIPCLDEEIDDLGWESKVYPESVCPGDPFTAEGFIIQYLKNKTTRVLYPPGTITFRGDARTVGPTNAVVTFTAPDTPGRYPVNIVIDIGGNPTDLSRVLIVNACGAVAENTGTGMHGSDPTEPVSEGSTAAGDLDVPYDVLSNPDMLNPVSGDRDSAVQLMFVDVVADELQPLIVAGAELDDTRGPRYVDVLAQVRSRERRREPLSAHSALAGLRTLGAPGAAPTAVMLRASFSPPIARSRVRRPAAARPRPQAAGATGPRVSAFITSLGTSYGEAMQLQLFNEGGAPARLVGKGIVVEPLKDKAKKEMQDQLRKFAGKNPVTAKLNAYCLEFLREPPSLGAVFRIASPELQEKFKPLRYVFDASSELQTRGGLTPDTEASEYFHSIRQWAIWSKEQGFDNQEAFGKAFVDRTKKNFEDSDQEFTKEIETVVRGLVANRWKDVSNVLTVAERLAQMNGLPW